MRIDKCGYYILTWKQNKQGLMKLEDEEYEELRIQQAPGNPPTVMKRMKFTQPFKYVGITTTPDGDTNSSIKALNAICYTFKTNINITELPSEYYKKALHTIFVPRIRYQTAVYNISFKEYQTIQKIYEGNIIWGTITIGQVLYVMVNIAWVASNCRNFT